MKKTLFSLAAALAFLFCSSFFLPSIPYKLVTSEDLEGTWELISYKYGTETSFSAVPSFVKYRKLLAGNHYTWISYGENGDDVIGTGGGSFAVESGTYTEQIDFFHPVGNALIGSKTTFNFTLEEDTWSISGTIHSVKIDPETGRAHEIDTIKLAEVWRRLK